MAATWAGAPAAPAVKACSPRAEQPNGERAAADRRVQTPPSPLAVAAARARAREAAPSPPLTPRFPTPPLHHLCAQALSPAPARARRALELLIRQNDGKQIPSTATCSAHPGASQPLTSLPLPGFMSGGGGSSTNLSAAVDAHYPRGLHGSPSQQQWDGLSAPMAAATNATGSPLLPLPGSVPSGSLPSAVLPGVLGKAQSSGSSDGAWRHGVRWTPCCRSRCLGRGPGRRAGRSRSA